LEITLENVPYGIDFLIYYLKLWHRNDEEGILFESLMNANDLRQHEYAYEVGETANFKTTEYDCIDDPEYKNYWNGLNCDNTPNRQFYLTGIPEGEIIGNNLF